MDFLWILIPLTALMIPIVAILSGVLKDFLKAQEKQSRGSEGLEQELRALRQELVMQRESSEKRLATLEQVLVRQINTTRSLENPSSDEAQQLADLARELAPERLPR